MAKTYTGYTQEQLENAFKLVQNKEHWKNPINAYCTTDEAKPVAAAITYFTATIPTFNFICILDEDDGRFKAGDSILKVRADGYRKGPAGDH